MPRFEIKSSPISIAYGYDDIFVQCDYFLHVFDERLEWDKTASKEVNKITEMVGVQDGGGSYFHLHTGQIGFGFKVTEKTMAAYMKRYGVPDEHVAAVLKSEPFGQTCVDPKQESLKPSKSAKRRAKKLSDKNIIDESTSVSCADLNLNEIPNENSKTSGELCPICKQKVATKKCSKCKVMLYCGQECQRNDWSAHKFFCGSLPFPAQVKTGGEYVRGVLLPENSQDPILINILVEIKNLKSAYDCETFEKPDLKKFLGDEEIYGRNWMPLNPLKNERVFNNTIEFLYKEAFLCDGSKPNKTIQNITGGLNSHDWRGPMVVTKYSGQGAQGSYLNIELDDFADIIDYLKWYGTKNTDYIKRNVNYSKNK